MAAWTDRNRWADPALLNLCLPQILSTGIFNRIGRCSCSMMNTFELILRALVGLLRSKAALQAEVLVLSHQLNILRRKSPKRFVLTGADRAVFVAR